MLWLYALLVGGLWSGAIYEIASLFKEKQKAK